MKTKSLLFFNLYWAFGIIYFCFGRYNWHIPSYAMLLIYVFFNFLAVNLGYISVPSAPASVQSSAEKEVSERELFERCKTWFVIACFITMFFQISWVIVILGKFSITTAIQNIGENYYEKMYEFEGVSRILQIRTLFWIITYFVYPIGFYFFKLMSRFCKFVFVSTVIVEVFTSLNMGVSKNIGDLVFIYLATLFLSSAKRRDRLFMPKMQKSFDLNKKKREKSLFGRIALIIAIFLFAFSVIQSSRLEASGSVSENLFAKFSDLRSFSLFDPFLFWNKALLNLFDKMGEYVSHAYCGLAYALELPFENTYGLGFSDALIDYSTQYFGIENLRPMTYNARIEFLYGWKDGQWWPTAFTWFGNAVSLWLVPVVMFLFGRLFKNVENRWFRSNQILSLVMYCQLFIAFVYLSCNAQIFQGRHIFIATTVLFFLYFCINVLKVKIKWGNDVKKKNQ